MGLTDNPEDGCLKIMRADGQQECYLVLSEEDRRKQYIRPLRHSYIHIACGVETTMAGAIAETYARQPTFYGGTFCAGCRDHFPLWTTPGPNAERKANFSWADDGTPVGS